MIRGVWVLLYSMGVVYYRMMLYFEDMSSLLLAFPRGRSFPAPLFPLALACCWTTCSSSSAAAVTNWCVCGCGLNERILQQEIKKDMNYIFH